MKKGIGGNKLHLLSQHYDVIISDVPEPAEDEQGGVAILTTDIKEKYTLFPSYSYLFLPTILIFLYLYYLDHQIY